jgi:lipopolysaccharide export system permease protein
MVLIFDRLCGVMILLAAMFTVTWMLRNNELLPLLSAGVPTRRVLQPVILGACVMLALGVANREILMPRVAEQLENPASDPRGEGVRVVTGAYEPNGVLIAGQHGYRDGKLVKNFCCTIPERLAGSLLNITAAEARYIPPGDGVHSGGWLLTETNPATLPPTHWTEEVVLEFIDPGKFFLHTTRVDFDAVTRSNVWYQYASIWDIVKQLDRSEGTRLAGMAVQIHLRLTIPFLTLVMVIMGMAIILRDQCRNVFLNAGMCLIVAALFYGACYLTKYLGEHEYLSPTMAAWLPVLVFGPPAMAMADAIHT